MKTKEQIVHDYWMAEYRENQRKRMERQIASLGKKELEKPQYQIILQDENGVWEYHQAKPVDTQKLRFRVEFIWFWIAFVSVFLLMEDYIHGKMGL